MATTTEVEKPIGINIGETETESIVPEPETAVYVIFTSIDRTIKALEKAREISRPVGANIVVVAVQVVPFPLPLDRPPVPMEFVIRRFEEKADEFPEGTKISAYLCRDPIVALKRVLNRNCPVIMGVRKKMWPNRDQRLAGKLKRAGYEIILVETE
jgi:hypothetical protein